MIGGQIYGLSGRSIKPNYVAAVNSGVAGLGKRKEIADTEEYRKKTLALEAEKMAQNESLARDMLDAQEKETEQSNVIGLGQLGYKAYQGRQRDTALKEVLTGGGGTDKSGGSLSPSFSGNDTMKASDEAFTSETPSSFGLGSKASGIWEGVKGGASNWGDIAMGTGVGATLGASLGEKYISKNDTGRAIGGAVTAGALSYLSSGNPYTAALSSIFGGGLAALL